MFYLGKASALTYHDLSLTWWVLHDWRFVYCVVGTGRPWKSQTRSDPWAHQLQCGKTPGLVPQPNRLPGSEGLAWAAHAHIRASGDLVDASRMPWVLVCHAFLCKQWSAWPGWDKLMKKKLLLVLPIAWAELIPGPGLGTGGRALRVLRIALFYPPNWWPICSFSYQCFLWIWKL